MSAGTPAVRLRQAAQRLRTGGANVCCADLDGPLAAWLEQESGRLTVHPDLYGPGRLAKVLRANHGPALAVADVILAGGEHHA